MNVGREALHLAALLPVFALIVRPREGFVLLGLAFAASWVGDWLNQLMGGTFVAFYLWVPLQIGLAFLAVEEGYRRRIVAFAVLLMLVPLSIILSYPAPEVLVMALGSVAVVLLAKGDLRWPVYLYFGAGSALHLLMVWCYHSGNPVMMGDPVLGAYHDFRLGAFAVFTALVLQRTPPWRSSSSSRSAALP